MRVGARCGAAGDEEEELKAAAFDFERSVTYWSDYLQAHLHPRSLAPLSSHERNWSEMRRWGDGVGDDAPIKIFEQ